MKRMLALLFVLCCAPAEAGDFRCQGLVENGGIFFRTPTARTISDHNTVVTYGGPIRIPAQTMAVITEGGTGSRRNTFSVCWFTGFRRATTHESALFVDLIYEDNVPDTLLTDVELR